MVDKVKIGNEWLCVCSGCEMSLLEIDESLLEDKSICKRDIKTKVNPLKEETRGVGVVEARRGTLVHDYKADSNGKRKDVNLIAATCHNNIAFNTSLKLETKDPIRNGQPPSEEGLNVVEIPVHSYDPCFSCATYTIGNHLAMEIEIVDYNSRIITTTRNF